MDLNPEHLKSNRDRRLYRWVWLVLLAGLIASFALVIAGIAWMGSTGTAEMDSLPFREILSLLKAGDPPALVALGIVVLLATPVAALVAATVVFTLEKNPSYAAISLAVLAMLALIVFFGL